MHCNTNALSHTFRLRHVEWIRPVTVNKIMNKKETNHSYVSIKLKV